MEYYDKKADEFIGYRGVTRLGETFVVLSWIVDETRRRKYLVHFNLTGYEGYYRKENIENSVLHDPYYPSYCGIACLGLAKSVDPNDSSKGTREYTIWSHMIRRCYDQKDKDYNLYGGAGVRVCNRWLCFEYFLQDLSMIPGYDEWLYNDRYRLDKDILQKGIPSNQKIYSPQTCCFVDTSINIIEAIQRRKISTGNNLPVGINPAPNGMTGYMVTLGHTTFGCYEDLDAAINMRNYVVKACDNISNEALIPVDREMTFAEIRQHAKVPTGVRLLCRIMDGKPKMKDELCVIA